jgi:hypothetical protein
VDAKFSGRRKARLDKPVKKSSVQDGDDAQKQPKNAASPDVRSKKKQSRWLLADEKRERRIALLRKGLRIRMENAGVDDDRDLYDAEADVAILAAAREVRAFTSLRLGCINEPVARIISFPAL